MKLRLLLAPLMACALVSGACSRDEIVDVDPEAAPGPTSPTLESILDEAQLDSWIDTVFRGFSRVEDVTYIQVLDGAPLGTSRGLIVFNDIDTTVTISGNRSAVQAYDSARVVIGVDSTQTYLAAAGTILQLIEVQQEWGVSATWEFAVDTPGTSIPWLGGPGGSLGPTVLSEDTLSLIVTDTTTEMPDSLIFWLGEASDSLLKLWADTLEVNTGLAVVVADSGQVRLFGPRVDYNIIPVENPDTAVGSGSQSTGATFIFDPTGLENTEGILRVGGIDGWRIYAQFIVPDSVPVLGSTELYRLRGSTINTAELLLVSIDPPPQPFRAEIAFGMQVYELADDFRLFGPKTPVGNPVAGSAVILDPDSVVASDTVRVEITRLLQAWANAPPDSIPQLRFLIRPDVQGSTFGFWEFGAIDGDPGFKPTLRIVFTPPVGFTVP